MFFAYVTKAFLDSRWCIKELQHALSVPGVTVAPYADSRETFKALSDELMDEVKFGFLDEDNYSRSLLELSGRAWESLQTFERVVPARDHILAGPAIFDSAGYSRDDLMKRTKKELVLAGSNLRSWMSDDESKRGLVSLVKERRVRVTLIMATYETLRPISREGAVHLRESVKDVKRMLDMLDDDERHLMTAHFHVGASTLLLTA